MVLLDWWALQILASANLKLIFVIEAIESTSMGQMSPVWMLILLQSAPKWLTKTKSTYRLGSFDPLKYYLHQCRQDINPVLGPTDRGYFWASEFIRKAALLVVTIYALQECQVSYRLQLVCLISPLLPHRLWLCLVSLESFFQGKSNIIDSVGQE